MAIGPESVAIKIVENWQEATGRSRNIPVVDETHPLVKVIVEALKDAYDDGWNDCNMEQ